LKKWVRLKICGTLGKMGPHLEKCSALGKVRYTWESAALLEKCGTFEKLRRTWKNAPHLEKRLS